jgi:outer membrane protein OmpA-like peptidoglycan-associated protein
MSHTTSRRFAALAAAASLQALLLSGSALAQGVRMFEEAPPLEVLRNIMIPESRPGGLTRRIVITPPDRPAAPVMPAMVADPERNVDTAPAAAPQRRPSWSQPKPAQMLEPTPILASARMPAAAAPAAPVIPAAMPAPAPAAVPRETSAAGIVGFRINFALNSDVVPQAAYAFVDRIGELMREQPQVKLQVEGHTDALGSDEYNLLLSAKRAAAVANYLVQRQGIDPMRLVVLGKGESEPLGENAHEARNRRVQFMRAD